MTKGLMTKGSLLKVAVAAALAASVPAGPALAGTGLPTPWQMDMQGMVTEIGREIHSFHNWLLILITLISLFVLGLLIYVIVKFNETANPTPSRTTHHTGLEVAWTIVPIIILVAISIPSFRLLRHQLIVPSPDLVVKATGYAWYWGYEYAPEQGGIRFEQRLVADPADQSKALPGPDGTPKLLAVDNEMVVPVNKVVRVQVTAADVLHAFAIPSFGIKVDAVPGRLNETWFKAEREGVYHGQCSELCGQFHAYMPITIRVVSDQQFATWIEEAKKKFAANELAAPTRLAANAP